MIGCSNTLCKCKVLFWKGVNEVSKLRTIGEISKLLNVPVRTLHYYDEIGLFKPAFVDPKTNYRYYSESQVPNIDLIKSLKYIGTPLEDIKYAQQLTPEELLGFLEEQQVIVEERVRRMQEVQETLMRTMKLLKEQTSIPALGEVYELETTDQRLIAIKTTDATVMEVPDRYFISLSETVEREGSVMNSRYGGIFELKNYASAYDIYYDYLFSPLLTERYLEQLNSDIEVLKMPAGRYLAIAFNYNEKAYLDHYERLREYIEMHGIEPQSPVYDVFMPTSFRSNEQPKYIVELKIKF